LMSDVCVRVFFGRCHSPSFFPTLSKMFYTSRGKSDTLGVGRFWGQPCVCLVFWGNHWQGCTTLEHTKTQNSPRLMDFISTRFRQPKTWADLSSPHPPHPGLFSKSQCPTGRLYFESVRERSWCCTKGRNFESVQHEPVQQFSSSALKWGVGGGREIAHIQTTQTVSN